MSTLWQKLTGSKPTPAPVVASKPAPLTLSYNPLNLSKGDFIKIKTVDTEDYSFQVTRIRLVDRIINQNTHRFIDYDLLARDLNGNEIRKHIQVTPKADAPADYDALLLTFITEFGYDEDYFNSLNADGTVEEPVVGADGNVVQDAEGKDEVDTFWRVNDYKQPWTCKAIADNAPKSTRLTYWDFWRETTKDGNKSLEFYFVEMDESHFFTIWRGPKIDSTRIGR